MLRSANTFRTWMAVMGAAIPTVILFVNVLSLVLTGAQALHWC